MKALKANFLLLSILFLVSCQGDSQKFDFRNYNILDSTEFNIDYEASKEEFPTIEIDLLKVLATDKKSEKTALKINQSILDRYAANINFEEDSNLDLEKTIINFINAYQRDKAAFPDMAGVYEVNLSARPTYISNRFLSVRVQSYTYTGGAHGYGSLQFINFDLKTGEEYILQTQLKDEDVFLKFVEAEFRRQRDIESSSNLNEFGYWFEDDKFQLPREMGFDGDKLILIYNPYEIASYADGHIQIEIPIEDVKSYFDIKL